MEGMSEFTTTFMLAVGWLGAFLTVGAYALVTRGRVAPDSLTFQGLNIVGGCGLALSAAVNGAWPSVVTNIVWVAIGVQAILSLRRFVSIAKLRRSARSIQEALECSSRLLSSTAR